MSSSGGGSSGGDESPIPEESASSEPYYIYLTNSVLDGNLQKYISAYIEHISQILEPSPSSSSPSEKAPPRKLVTFIKERNGLLLFGFKPSTVRVIYKLLKKMDEEKHNLHFDINLVLVESHKMTGQFEW